MSGPYHVSKIQCYQGVDLEETRLFFSPPADDSTDLSDLAPMDFGGGTARMMVRLRCDPSATQVLTLNSSGGGGLDWVSDTFAGGPAVNVDNGIRITITRDQSLEMNGGVPFVGGYYDVLVDTAEGTTLHLMAGQFDLMATVTRQDL